MRGTVRWALSPVDCRVHLLVPAGYLPWGVLKTRCGQALLPQGPRQPERSPGGAHRTCPTCALIAKTPVSVPVDPWVPCPPTTAEGQAGAGHRETVRAMWVRCRVDQHLHLLGARAVLDLAALGCTVAYCGALLITPQLVVRGGGDTMRAMSGCQERVMSGKHHKTTTGWWRCLGRRPQATKPRRLVIAMVEAVTGLEHWVAPEAFEQGMRERTGYYVVLCGRRIPVASMVTPPGPSCLPCQEARQARAC